MVMFAVMQDAVPLETALQQIQVYCPHTVHQHLAILDHLALQLEVCRANEIEAPQAREAVMPFFRVDYYQC